MINLNEEAFLGKEEKYTLTDESDFLESYFHAGIETASEFSEAYTEASSDLYKGIKANNGIATFAAFKATLGDIIKAYIVKMNNRMYNQFSAAFKTRIREDKKVIDKYRKKLNNYDGKPIELSVTRYNYSNIFNSDIPSMKVIDSYKNEREQMDMLMSSTSDESKKKAIRAEFNKIKDYISSGECYNNARASILKSGTPIEPENYAKAIFDVYRSGGDQVVDYSIMPVQIREAVKRFYSYEKYLDAIDGDKRKVFDKYNYILSHLEKYDMFQMKGLVYDEEVLKEYELYIKLKADQLMHYCSLYLTAFDGKLDALANSYMQDRDILLKVCGYITADEEKEEE